MNDNSVLEPLKSPSKPLPAGTNLKHGRYLILSVLGKGGFGITYLALDQLSYVKVAIKELFPYSSGRTYADPLSRNSVMTSKKLAPHWRNIVERFLETATTLIALRDISGIVSVYDYFEENNTAYQVMQFVRGFTLHDQLRSHGPLPLTSALRYIRQVAEPLRLLHERGILHLDIKPSNIIVDKMDEVYLIDFDSARSLGTSFFDSSGLTSGSARFGSPELFLSLSTTIASNLTAPESISKPGPHTDVYSLAATFCYLLTGTYYSPTNDVALSKFEQIDFHLAQVIRHALSFDPETRTRTVGDFLGELEGTIQPVIIAAKQEILFEDWENFTRAIFLHHADVHQLQLSWEVLENTTVMLVIPTQAEIARVLGYLRKAKSDKFNTHNFPISADRVAEDLELSLAVITASADKLVSGRKVERIDPEFGSIPYYRANERSVRRSTRRVTPSKSLPTSQPPITS